MILLFCKIGNIKPKPFIHHRPEGMVIITKHVNNILEFTIEELKYIHVVTK